MNDRDYWFPAKRYGWGWGTPRNWRGRIFLLLWVAFVVVGVPSLNQASPIRGFIFLIGMIAVLLLVIHFKGEPPSWRWGGRR